MNRLTEGAAGGAPPWSPEAPEGAGTGRRRRVLPGARRAGGVATWICLLVCAAGAVLLVEHLQRRVEARGFHIVDPARVRTVGDEAWFDPRWRREFEFRLADQPPLDFGDRTARAALVQHLLGLSFVAEVGDPVGIWPDGLSLEVRPHVPVACVLRQDKFLAVAADGTVLSGAWAAPPRRGGGWLPVLGPNDGVLDGVRPGDVLELRHHLDALAVAESLWQYLGEQDQERLGRVLIDARRSPATSPDEPGTVIWLEDSREVWFGRSPAANEPGSLPTSTKWSHIALGLAHLSSADRAQHWLRLDVRWDRAEVVLDGAPPSLLAPDPGGDLSQATVDGESSGLRGFTGELPVEPAGEPPRAAGRGEVR